jgi:hypothetical protein
MLGQQAAEVGGATVEDDNDRCLYFGTLWEDDVITEHRDVDDFKEASRMLAVSTCTCTLTLQLLSLMLGILRGLESKPVFLYYSHLLSELRPGRAW